MLAGYDNAPGSGGQPGAEFGAGGSKLPGYGYCFGFAASVALSTASLPFS